MKILKNSLKLSLSLESREIRCNVFAFLYDGNKLLSVGRNNMKELSSKALYFGRRYGIKHWVDFPFKHAEVDVISKLWGKSWITDREKLVVVRLDKGGNIKLARPCVNCTSLLQAIGIKKVYFTTEKGWGCL